MDLAQFAPALFQLAVDTGQVLLPGMHLGMDIGLVHLFLQRLADLIDSRLAFAPLRFHSACKFRIPFRLKVTERQVF